MSIKNKKKIKIKIKIKKEKEKGAYIPIILERAGNYNGIFWYRNILIFYFGITSLSLSLSIVLHSVCFVVIFFTASKPHRKIKIFNF